MAKKSSGRSSLKTLFSRSDGGRSAPARTTDGEQKKPKLKLLKLRIKAKDSQRAADEGRHAASASESRSPAEPVEVDHITSLKKSSTIYGTTPRSKAKEFSYSESDLRKPKRFATFSFGLKKRKKRNEETLSKSSFVLDEQESLLDLARRNLDQSASNRQFSSSQPELDSGFDIPSPPPLTKNLSAPYFALPDCPSSLLGSRPQSEELLTDIEETVRAPIASIPELQLETSSSEETETCLAVCPSTSSFGASLSQNPVKRHFATTAISHVSTATAEPTSGTSDRPKAPGREGSLSPISESVEQNSYLFSPEKVYEALYESLFPKKLMVTPPASTYDPALTRVHTASFVEPVLHDLVAPRSQDSLRNVTSTEGRSDIDATTLYSDPKFRVRCSGVAVSAGRDSAAPVSDCVTSQRTRARVAVPITRAEKLSPDQAPAPEAPRRFPGLLAPMDASDRPLSPAYLSVGSDEGSAADVYYSAQEDNVEESGDEMFTVSERQERFQGGSVEDVETNSSRIVGMKQEGDLCAGEAAGLQGPFVTFRQKNSLEDARTGSVGKEEADISSGPARGELPPLLTAEDNHAGSEARELSDKPGSGAPAVRPKWAETADCLTAVHPQVPVEVLASHQGAGEAAEPNAEEVRDQLNDRFLLESLLTSESESAAMMSSSLYTPQSARSSPPPGEDAPNYDSYKVSLMDEVDSGPDFRWKNRFYGVTPYKPSSTEEDLTPSPSAAVAIGNRDSEEWRRSSEWEEPAAPAGKGDERREGEAESEQSHRNSEQPEFTCSSLGDSPHSGVFRATLVELVPDPPSMEPSLKRGSPAPRPQAPPPQPIYSLPPIKEDATPDATPKKPEGNLNIPVDLGLGSSCTRDTRSPLELMKSQDFLPPDMNGNGPFTLTARSSRLNNSVLFGSLMTAETDNKNAHLPSNRRSSLPETRLLSANHIGLGSAEQSEGQANLTGSRPLGVSDPAMSMLAQNPGVPSGGQTALFGNVHGVTPFQQPEPEQNMLCKYRAFPDAYLTKEKEHGKLNPRPGKIFIYDRPGMCGQRWEVRGDVSDATSWELQETISVRVVRGGWVLYEKPNFKGEKIALDEGDIELTCPFNPPEEPQENGVKKDKENGGETEDQPMEGTPARRFIIGSMRRAVRDYSATSIIVNAGLWLVFAEPFFQGNPRILEVGGYTNPAAWGVEKPYVGSLHPLKVGEPRVENRTEPEMIIFDKPYFSGKSRLITANMRDFISRTDSLQSVFMGSVGSLKVLGGIWVGFQKEGFRGHQYLLEEGEYQDWRVWGGCDSELRSARIIRADLADPMVVLHELPEEEEEENSLEAVEAVPDVELLGFKTSTRSIHVLSGAWIAYSHVDFSGNQYILEKGFYSSCADWGGQDSRICSIQPILPAPSSKMTKLEIVLYSEQDFQGECHTFDQNYEALAKNFLTKSCRVSGSSWVLYEEPDFSGDLYVVSEGDYPNLLSMGCPPKFHLRSFKMVPLAFSVPSISLFGLECHEGREITLDSEIFSLVQEGFNNHILSVRVNSGCWVICEYSGYRGRQFLLDQIEITNWPKFSCLQTIGSMYPIRQKRHFFRLKNVESGHFLSLQGGVDEMKSGRVVVAPEAEPLSDIWFYQDGLIKNKLAPAMSLQVMGNVEPAAKVVLWTETRQPIQTWTAEMKGPISSLTFPGMVLDVKGGRTYDHNHAARSAMMNAEVNHGDGAQVSQCQESGALCNSLRSAQNLGSTPFLLPTQPRLHEL
ncbi:hypothetical protein OJAV_G00109170 [Oryzias javanicus]|uniref:Beta/gamma crystallin 'Greek key' domain-containing protein n=1 Tax=Oryzias javanicus TaxID=123683 RepID=A0A437CUH7_ORYJA|nr:hypothetical protein OJAV_G00109170 [Oryzias javanicus]